MNEYLWNCELCQPNAHNLKVIFPFKSLNVDVFFSVHWFYQGWFYHRQWQHYSAWHISSTVLLEELWQVWESNLIWARCDGVCTTKATDQRHGVRLNSGHIIIIISFIILNPGRAMLVVLFYLTTIFWHIKIMSCIVPPFPASHFFFFLSPW